MKRKFILLLAIGILSTVYWKYSVFLNHIDYVNQKYKLSIPNNTALIFEKEESGDFDGSFVKIYVFDLSKQLNDIEKQVKALEWQRLPINFLKYGSEIGQYTNALNKGYYLYKEDSTYITNFDLAILDITKERLIIYEKKTH